MNSRSKRGAALALVVIFAFVLSILAAAVYALFRSNVTTHQWNWERIQARYTAEAGCNLAVQMILGGSDVPQDSTPVRFLPESGLGWYDLPGDEMGLVLVYVDPNNNNDQVSTGNAYEIRALGRIQTDATYDYGMATMVIPENFSRFATFLNESPMGGYYGDGYRFDGPFFCNGPVCVYSGSASSTNDIWFYRFTLASDFYYFSTGSASNPQTSPQVGNLTMQPIERMMLGAPHFELGVDPIPFGPDEVNWEDARDAAQSGGLYFASGEIPNGTRMIICQDTLFVKTSDNPAAEQYFLLDSLENPVVWIDNGAGDNIYIKSMPPYVTGSTPTSPNGLSLALTIGCNGTIRPLGPLQYQNRDLLDPDNDIMLGLLSVYGNFEIPYDPSIPDPDLADWEDPYKIVMDSDVEIDAVVMDLDGEFKAQNYQYPQPIEDFMIMGGYIVNDEGYTTWGSMGGWNTVIYYDTRLMTMHPPFFPQTGRWDVVFWEEIPDMDDHSITWDRQ